MEDKLSREEVLHVAHLANIKLNDDEIEKYRVELKSLLNEIDKIMDWKTAMNFFRNGAGKNLNWKTGVELPRAQDIADAVGNTSWNLQDKDYNGWFCLETNKQDTTSYPYCYNNTQKTGWLWNYTRECADWKCSNSLDSNYAYGYWTGDMVSKQLDTTARALGVSREGYLRGDSVSITAYDGVRPVITVSKANLSN